MQDFEGFGGEGKWPRDAPGVVARTTEWRADGEASLRIDPGLVATIDDLRRSDFRGYDALRVRVHNAGSRLAVIGFELSDGEDGLHDRHRTSFGAPPGDSTIDLDLSGGLWRGEENRPYRGKKKTPVDLGEISRIRFENRGEAAVYVDGLTLVNDPLPQVPGGFAFDFGKRGQRVMAHTTGVFEDSVPSPEARFGFVGGKPSALDKVMSYPTPLLGDGLAWGDAAFEVELPGGPYTGWIAFERGGFWEEEATGYSRAALLVGWKEAHAHTFTPAGPHFLFQDVEITSVDQVEKELVWPAHAIHRFSFVAEAGRNTFALNVEGRTGPPLRVAGLVLAPDTREGRAFVDAHEERQRQMLKRTYPERDEARRPSQEPAAPPDRPLVVTPRPIGEVAHPGDRWREAAPARHSVTAFPGHRAMVQLALEAPVTQEVAVSVQRAQGGAGGAGNAGGARDAGSAGDAGPAGNAGPADDAGGTQDAGTAAVIPEPHISYAVYGPKRPYSGGAAWIEAQYYRPIAAGERVRVGPGLSRSLLLDFQVPVGAAAGRVDFVVRFSGRGEDGGGADGGAVLSELPVSIEIVPVELPGLPIPVGLFMSGLPFGPEVVGEERWWALQEDLLAAMGEAGLNTPTGGVGLEYKLSESGGDITISGERALRYLGLAKKHGLDRAVVGYSGFLPSIKYRRPDAARFQKAWARFEAEHGLPKHYLYSYDEPSTPEELAKVAGYLGPFAQAGARTIGFLGRADEERFTPILDATYAPAVNGHTEKMLRRWIAEGRHVWLYNQGTTRRSMGADLYRQARLGIEGRLEWIGLYTQGFAFHDLDGREPSYGMFVVHERLGVLPTPRWLSLREGLLDLRVRLALDKALAPGERAPLWPDPSDPAKWPDAALDAARAEMVRRLVRPGN